MRSLFELRWKQQINRDWNSILPKDYVTERIEQIFLIKLNEK